MKIRRFIFLMIALWMVSSVMTARQKIGLVLGGGGAKGAAEVGVLKVLEEAGVKPDYIVGTSIGSIVGGLYAAGYTATELETMFKTQEWLSLLTDRNAGLSNEPYITKNGFSLLTGIGNLFGLGGIIEWITTRPDIDKYMDQLSVYRKAMQSE